MGSISCAQPKDIFEAADHLRGLDVVDPDRIAVAGYSFGAMLAVLASSGHWGDAIGDGRRFDAAVAFYPGCHTISSRRGDPYEIVNRDIDRCLLVLLGEKDSDTPYLECTQRLGLARRAGPGVE